MKSTHPGRPPLDEDDHSARICLSVPGKQFDALDALATRERVTIQDLIRRALADDRPPRKTYTK